MRLPCDFVVLFAEGGWGGAGVAEPLVPLCCPSHLPIMHLVRLFMLLGIYAHFLSHVVSM